MPYLVINKLAECLDRTSGKGLNGARILLMGIAYKKNIDDMRESPALKLIELIEKRGARVEYHDPFIPVIPHTREHADLTGRTSVHFDADGLSAFDAVLIATDHDGVDYSLLASHARCVVDTRNVCVREKVSAAHIFKA
jgi:UDP-N-acetyl-D-glucosamine dehydrogenase